MIRVDAFAKLTLSLRVVGRRSDGYHEIDALMVSISDPRDRLEIEPAGHTSIEVTGPFADGAPADETNLVWRALDAVGVRAAVRLHKGIPHGAGLGGGSADAAAVLRAFDGDARAAAALGADVPFCLLGGAARVRGVGDQLEPLPVPSLHVVVATPPFGCSTAAVYAAWDALGSPTGGDNDLEAAAVHVEPRLGPFRRAVEAAAGVPAVLAGSGSSYAVVFDEPAEATRARDRMAGTIEGSVWLAEMAGPV
jgi:4-diphosphocytidyl-2-C-methyl-D-erythritol kinase